MRLRTGVWPLCAALVVGAGLSAPTGAFAAPFDVNDVSDAHDVNPGDGVCNVVIEGGGVLCTLRAAVEEANALSGPDEVKVPAGNYNLKIDQGGAIAITSDLIIGGAGARSTVIRQERNDQAGIGDRVFDIQGVDPPPAVTISAVTIADGRAQAALGSFGGNIRSTGDLRLVDSTIMGGRAFSGGGIANVSGTLLVENSTITGNSAPDGGGDSGAIQNFEDALIGTASLTVRNSTISGNSARLGGGIFNWSNSASPVGNTISITNSTITGNSSGDRGGGGGLALASNATATVTNTIISGNTFQDLLFNCSADPGSAITSLGNNLENAKDCRFTASGDLQSTDPLLGEFGNYGGGTDTHALGAGSPAIDAADDAACPSADQRGILRPQGRSCDIGAFELELAPETTITSGPTGPTSDATPTFAFTSSEPGTFQCRVDAQAFVACSSPFTTPTLPDGPHTFEVRAIDAANNPDPAPAARAVTVDTQSPDTAITTGPAGLTGDATPTFAFSSNEPGTFECRIDAAPFASCSSPFTTGTLTDGSHTFDVRAVDGAQNTDATPASRPFSVDAQAPAAPTVTGSEPASPADDNQPELKGTAEPGSTVRLYPTAGCSGTPAATGTAAAFTSPGLTVTVTDDSTTQFRATATDLAGNTSPCSSAPLSYVEDSTMTLAELNATDPPTLGRDANIAPVGKGEVDVCTDSERVCLASLAARGSQTQKGQGFVPLEEAAQIPIGSFLDTRRGTVRMVNATGTGSRTQSGTFRRGVFQVLQSRARRARGLTELRLKGSSFRRCRTSDGKGASAALSRATIRRLRASARGRYRTSGRNSSATIRGTIWITADRCDGTLTTVTRGKVVVRDFRRKRTVVVSTGKSYLARAPR